MHRPSNRITVKRGLIQLSSTIFGLFTGAIIGHFVVGVHGCS